MQRILKKFLVFGPSIAFYAGVAVIIAMPLIMVFVAMSGVILFLSAKGLYLLLANYGTFDLHARVGFSFLCAASGLATLAVLLFFAAAAFQAQKLIRKISRTILENL